MKKLAIIGKYCYGFEAADGQSIKTRILTQELQAVLGPDAITQVDTYGWKHAPLKLFTSSIRAVLSSKNIIFMTDAGGIKIFPWLLLGANLFARHKLHYVVVGAWLVSYLQKQPLIAACLRRFDTLFVETTVMERGLQELGFQNVRLMPNCKPLKPLKPEELTFPKSEPYRFCTFSRVMREKGIEDAVEAVRFVNDHFGRTVCTLDICGQIDAEQTGWFADLSASFPDYVRYLGVVPYDESVDLIKGCHALLFPTHFYTEGIPGTLIDAYAAGVSVISARWESFSDVVEEGVTGLGFPLGDGESLKKILLDVVKTPGILHDMKENCLKKAKTYLPEQVMDILLHELA